MSQYRAYFVPGGIDPTGESIASLLGGPVVGIGVGVAWEAGWQLAVEGKSLADLDGKRILVAGIVGAVPIPGGASGFSSAKACFKYYRSSGKMFKRFRGLVEDARYWQKIVRGGGRGRYLKNLERLRDLARARRALDAAKRMELAAKLYARKAVAERAKNKIGGKIVGVVASAALGDIDGTGSGSGSSLRPTFDFDRAQIEITHARLHNFWGGGLLAHQFEPSHLVWGAGYWTKERCWKVWYENNEPIRMQEVDCANRNQTMGTIYKIGD